MTISRPWRRFRPGRVEAILIGVTLVAIGGYFGMLHALDGRAETYFRNLRVSNPSLYLTQLRESRGFATYLAEYQEIWDYHAFKPAAPDFLVGRWTMRPAPLRLTPGTAPEQCIDPVTFDYGILLLLESDGTALRVGYRIVDQSVELKAEGFGTYTIDLVSYGAQLDHITFRPPGRTETVFAYNCGR